MPLSAPEQQVNRLHTGKYFEYDAALFVVVVVVVDPFQLHRLPVLPQAILVLLVWMVSTLDNGGNSRVLLPCPDQLSSFSSVAAQNISTGILLHYPLLLASRQNQTFDPIPG